MVKQESASTGGNPADDVEYLNAPGKPNEDAPDVRGLYFQNDTSTDTTAIISRDVSNNMTFTDAIAGSYTLTQLAGVTYNDFLLDCEPNTVDHNYTINYTGNKVTKETYTKVIGLLTAKTIDYTYTGNKIDTEVRKVYNVAGITVIAQLTITYSYTGNKVTSATYVRNI